MTIIGTIIRENHLIWEIRVVRKIQERKGTTVVIQDLVKKDYNNKNHKQMIRTSDLAYIVRTYDAPQILFTFQ